MLYSWDRQAALSIRFETLVWSGSSSHTNPDACKTDSYLLAVSRLVRDGIRAQGMTAVAASPTKSKFALLPVRDEVITSEHVRDLMDQEKI